MNELISFEEARRIVLAAAPTSPTERVPLAEALGRTLAEPVVSRDSIPPFDNAQMDGFAVRAADLRSAPTTLEVAGEVAAGQMPTVPVRPGTCVRIMTGAPVPAGADAVAPVEWTEAEGERVRFERAPAPGQYVRRAGEDLRPGAEAVAAGEVVTPPVVGIAATLGVPELTVRRVPRVAVVATGDELIEAGEPLGPGQIRNANGPALAAQAVAAGGHPLGPFVARDSEAGTQRVLVSALDADVIVVSGGVSMGERDVVRRVLDTLGWEPAFWKVRQRPGKPLAFGVMGGRPVVGLPGNPVSSAVCFEQYVRPLLAQMLGRRAVLRPRRSAVLAEAVRKAPGLHHFVRVTFEHGADGRLRVRPTGAQGSHLYTSVLRADGLMHLPEPLEDPPAGTPVAVERLAW
ncbi:MAG: molybdopterin molybdotransferase MoeA [Rhodothermales bacterium]|nr:molybdopterin molybdotransferase MoeA [Rhodothermales bacterium]